MINLVIVNQFYIDVKIGISDARNPQPGRDLDAETVLVKLQLDACNS